MTHNDLISYLGGLTVTQGRLAGQPFPVFAWQRRFLRGAFAPDAIESAISVARGNGKSTFTAGLACAVLDGPLFQPRGEVVVVASSFSQAKIIFRTVSHSCGRSMATNWKTRRCGESRTARTKRKSRTGAAAWCSSVLGVIHAALTVWHPYLC